MPLPFTVPPHWLRRAYWLGGSVLVLWVLAWLAVPPLVKQAIENKATAALGRTVSVEAVAFRPWSLELIVSGLAVAAKDGKTPQLQITRAYVDAELESLVRLAPVIDAITLDTPTLQLTHLGDGRYDVDDILERLDQAPASDDTAPLQFALYNLTLNGGTVDFSDHTASGVRQHSLRALNLAVPFVSTLESKRTVKVVPRLAFTLNGSQFDTAAEGTPFAQTQKGEASLKISKLDLAPYLPYLPSSLPVRLQSAVVDADIRLAFEQAKQQKLALTGTLKVSKLALADTAGAPLLAVESVEAALADVRPLDRVVNLASLDIHAPTLQGTRDRNGRINLSLDATKTVVKESATTGARGSKGLKAPAAAAPKPWSLSLERFALHRGALVWADDSIQPAARISLAELELQAKTLRWPLGATTATFEGSASLPSKGKNAARLEFKGEGAELRATAQATLADVELGLAAPYVAQFLQPTVQGVLDAELAATWTAGKPDIKTADTLVVSAPRLTLRDFALKGGKEAAKELVATTSAERAANEMPRFKLLEVGGAQLDVMARTGFIAKLALRTPSAMLHRDAQGQWMVQRWLKTAAPATAPDAVDAAKPSDTASNAAPNAAPATPWQISLAELAIDDGHFKLDDRSLARPVRLELSTLKLQLQNATLDGAKPAPLTLSARVKSGRTEPGSLNYRGTVMWAPIAAQGTVEAVDLPVHAIVPYLADKLNIAVLRADASFKGQVRYAAAAAGAEVQVQGDASLEDFRANTVAGSPSAGTPTADAPDLGVTEELLSWKSLTVPGVNLAMAPGTATRLQVRQANLSDFFARVIVNPSGRINLQDLVKTPESEAANTPQATQPSASASAPASAPISASAPSPLDAIVKMGPISLVNGKVLFSDRFIRPNYSANLSELQGTLSEFASQAADGGVQMADLDLRGRAEGTASLEVTGKVNPLAKPLALDIKGKVRDLDLPPLTAYSIKYAGYGIERGKLSMDVNYTVLPNGQLTASNKLVLNQLSFGDEVKGAPNSLPVKLAVALLADSNGVIDIDLPISGSLNDPQFSIGSLVWKVVTNLIGKALTSPFSLLAHAMGGGGVAGDEASTVVFAPGSSALSPAAREGLDQIAKALSTRPTLNVTVVGTASLEQERDALKRENLKALLLVEKRRRATVTGQDSSAATTLTDAEYPVLLAQVYRRADITKPRNVVGLAKDIPVPEMEALLLASIPVNEDTMRTLALQRGVVVKDYLASRKLPTERLFVGAAKTVSADADWKPRAELSVTQR
ncbi:DUF748 domain-containing protein [Rhodoferax sp. AJA081-3]|uniref:DUF748 domain-containing protein n=1 Tax=Rhodoferax sp. AJA081-3 TaxID=2752316 RepID=UPI001ADF9988|nr:DUF748 domain-containing protein [Rhodoferax sp. AJA081-3]QTN28156.1 DUF748 domain-containing protein [Rhodoferax sp. AJA081-3]